MTQVAGKAGNATSTRAHYSVPDRTAANLWSMCQLLRLLKRSSAAEDSINSSPEPNPEHAWKALALVNEWIRHSDLKAGVTLAFLGALGTMTFNLANTFEARSVIFDVTVVITCILLATTGALCGWTLTPRVNDKDASRDAINRLFYVSISQNFKGKREQYIDVFHTLTADPKELTRDLADQIHANANIATIKARWAKWAIRSALTSGAAVAMLAIVIGISNS